MSSNKKMGLRFQIHKIQMLIFKTTNFKSKNPLTKLFIKQNKAFINQLFISKTIYI